MRRTPTIPAGERERTVFVPVESCWICSGRDFVRTHRARFALDRYHGQDAALAAYSGQFTWIRRCRSCGFAQPEALPALRGYFARLYGQRWSSDWIAREFSSHAKDLIFRDVLDGLSRRLSPERRRLMDVGAHVGRFMADARAAGWKVEGVELNPRTSAFAARATGAPVHREDVSAARLPENSYDAVTMIDVLEHLPNPLGVLSRIRSLLKPGGWLGVKVPCGPSQLRKERLRAWLWPGYEATIAGNLVHVGHFSPSSLELALVKAGFTKVAITAAAPEVPGDLSRPATLVRQWMFALARGLPVGVRLPIALHLQAFAQISDR